MPPSGTRCGRCSGWPTGSALPRARRSLPRSSPCWSRWRPTTWWSAAPTTCPRCAPTPTFCCGGMRGARLRCRRRTGCCGAPRWAATLAPVWSSMAMHRPAEFNKSHLPAFLAGEPARDYVCVYPFVRSYEWYLLPDEERRELLAEHGRMARGYPDVRANTVASFALNDYEWMPAFQAAELHP